MLAHLLRGSFAAECILSQDKEQLSKQAPETALKQAIIHSKKISNDQRSRCENDQHINKMKTMFSKYIYPDHKIVLNLYNYHKKSTKY